MPKYELSEALKRTDLRSLRYEDLICSRKSFWWVFNESDYNARKVIDVGQYQEDETFYSPYVMMVWLLKYQVYFIHQIDELKNFRKRCIEKHSKHYRKQDLHLILALIKKLSFLAINCSAGWKDRERCRKAIKDIGTVIAVSSSYKKDEIDLVIEKSDIPPIWSLLYQEHHNLLSEVAIFIMTAYEQCRLVRKIWRKDLRQNAERFNTKPKTIWKLVKDELISKKEQVEFCINSGFPKENITLDKLRIE